MTQSDEQDVATQSGEQASTPIDDLPPLPLAVRIALHTIGWLLVVVGVIGIFLPGLQGLITIAAGLAVVSLGSETVRNWLEPKLHRWPRLWERIERIRRWLHRRFGRD